MDVTIKINCDDAAFEDHPPSEVARILRELAEDCGHLPLENWPNRVRDINGNTVGQVIVTDDEPAEYVGETCEWCDGSGIRKDVDNGRSIAPPDGFVVVECCDRCNIYDDDLSAAKAWGTSAIWQAADHDPFVPQAICIPPTRPQPGV